MSLLFSLPLTTHPIRFSTLMQPIKTAKHIYLCAFFPFGNRTPVFLNFLDVFGDLNQWLISETTDSLMVEHT